MKEEKAGKIPECVGLIMDGNRRWAKEAGLPAFEGHRAGYQKLKEVLQWAKEFDIHNVIVYALSTENWNRSKDEIKYLMHLVRTMLRDELDEITKEDVRIVLAGDLSRFPEDIQRLMHEAMERTKDKKPYTLVVAASYGGRAEIVHAVNALLEEGADVPVDEKQFASKLWTAGVPDPDMIVRTGGVERLSNFLPWQTVYSELFFTDTFWPNFSRAEFEKILKEFASRERRFGK